MSIKYGQSDVSSIYCGEDEVQKIYLGRTLVYSAAEPEAGATEVAWGGDASYVKDQTATIDKDNAGTVGRINLLERVYDQTVAKQFCVTADCVDAAGIAQVRVYYGGPTAYIATERTKVGNVQGYWFELQAASNPAQVEERVIFAEIIPNNPSIISRVVKKTIRVGQATSSDLDPGTGLHQLIANDGAIDNHIYELSTGIYWLEPYNPGVGTSDKWVELRAKDGQTPVIKIVPSVPTSSSYQRGQSDRSYFQCRASHLIVDGCILDTWYASFEVRGSSGFSGSCYMGLDGCTFQDEYNAMVGPICGFPRYNAVTGSNVPYFEQLPFRNGLNSRYELHASKVFLFDAAGAHEYFDCETSVGRDIIHLSSSTYFDSSSPGICINRMINKSYFRESTSDLPTVRLYDNISGTRQGFYDKAGRYVYDYDHLFDASEMVYTVESATIVGNDYVITMASGERFTQNSLPDWAAYEWAIYRWPAGVDLTLANREFIGDPAGATGDSYVLQWETTDRTVITYRDRRALPVQSLGINAGDRIAVVRWNHQDAFQFGALNDTHRFENIVAHDYISILEQQPIFENCQIIGGDEGDVSEVLDVVFNNCLWRTPTDLSGNAAEDLGTTSSQFYVTPLRGAMKFSTHPDHPFYLREDVAALREDEFDFRVQACVLRDISGAFGHESETWNLAVSDTFYDRLISINLATSPVDSTEYSVQDIDKWGVPGSGFAKTSLAQSLPFHIDGTSHTGQVGALPVGAEWEPTIAAYFVVFPKASAFNPTGGESVSVIDGILDYDHAASHTYQWRLNDDDIIGQTASSYVTASGDAGSSLSCLVDCAGAKSIVYFGVIQ